MTQVNLRQEPWLDKLVNVEVMQQGHWTDAVQPWIAMPMAPRRDIFGIRYHGEAHGVEVESVERACLPDTAAAVFHMDFGALINGDPYTIDLNYNANSAWDLMSSGRGFDVRISVADPPQGDSTGFIPAWKTIFIGTVVAQDDDLFAGDQMPGGRRTWRCSDLLWRTSRWPMNRHHNYNSGLMETHVEGHPGYNYACQGYYRRLIGNKEVTLASADPYGDLGALSPNYSAHTFAGIGAATIWTDLQTVNHSLVCSRAKGEPVFAVSGATALLSDGQFVWEVNDTMTCWDFINRVLARKRGRGVSFLDWTEDVGAPFNVHPKITVVAQTELDIVATPPVGPPIIYPGAVTGGTAVAVNLLGDQRVVPGSVQMSKNDTGTCDYLESEGEQIELLVTLSPGDGTLDKRWIAGDETAFAALDAAKPWLRNSTRWQYVWQRWGIPPGFPWVAKDGNNGADKGAVSGHPINWYCKDDGNYALGLPSVPSQSNSKTVSRILSDLPLYEGYDYTANALTRYDGAAQSTEAYAPPRSRPLILINANYGVAGANYIDAVTAIGAGLANDDFGLLIISGDASIGQRPFSGVAGPAAGVYDPNTLVVTVGLQLSNRVRQASANIDPLTALPFVRENAPRRRSLRFPGIFLWLADPAAIWSIYDPASGTNQQTALRLCAGGTITPLNVITPGVLRDDRKNLAQLHALAWAWYSVPHYTGQWQTRDCGFSPFFNLEPAGTQTYPTIGQVVTTLDVTVPYSPSVPITKIRWDVAPNVTTWVLDWADLDLT